RQGPLVFRPDHQRALDALRDRAVVRPHACAHGLPHRRLPRGRGPEREGGRRHPHGAATRPSPRARQGGRAPALAQRAALAGRARARRRAARGLDDRVRRRGRHRPPLPPSGRDRHPVRGDRRLRLARGQGRDGARARQHGAGARVAGSTARLPRRAAARRMTFGQQPPQGHPGQQPQGYPGVPPQGYATLPPYPVAPPPPPVEDPAPFHRLFRLAPNYRWWRPLVAVLIFIAFFLVTQVIIGVIWTIGMIVSGAGLDSIGSLPETMAQLTDLSNPFSLVLVFGSVAILLPLVPLAMLCAGLRPVSLRHSVAFRLRWRWMLWCVVPSLVITVLSTGLSFLPLLWGETLEPVEVDPASFALIAVLVVLLVPLQSAAEEYVFRGFIMQSPGAWARPPWLAT